MREGFLGSAEKNLATAVSNWEARKEKDNTTFKLISLTSMLVANEDPPLKKNSLKCQIFQTKGSEWCI